MIRRLGPGDESTLQEVCRRYKERVPPDEEAARLRARDDVYVWVAEDGGDERIGALKMCVQTDEANVAGQRTYEATGGRRLGEPDLLYTWRFR